MCVHSLGCAIAVHVRVLKVTVHVRGGVRTRGERLLERWINKENRLVEIFVDNTQTDKQTFETDRTGNQRLRKADIQTN